MKICSKIFGTRDGIKMLEEQKVVKLKSYEVEYVLSSLNDSIMRLKSDISGRKKDVDFRKGLIKQYKDIGKNIQAQTGITFVKF
jgi:hypothetical protein